MSPFFTTLSRLPEYDFAGYTQQDVNIDVAVNRLIAIFKQYQTGTIMEGDSQTIDTIQQNINTIRANLHRKMPFIKLLGLLSNLLILVSVGSLITVYLLPVFVLQGIFVCVLAIIGIVVSEQCRKILIDSERQNLEKLINTIYDRLKNDKSKEAMNLLVQARELQTWLKHGKAKRMSKEQISFIYNWDPVKIEQAVVDLHKRFVKALLARKYFNKTPSHIEYAKALMIPGNFDYSNNLHAYSQKVVNTEMLHMALQLSCNYPKTSATLGDRLYSHEYVQQEWNISGFPEYEDIAIPLKQVGFKPLSPMNIRCHIYSEYYLHLNFHSTVDYMLAEDIHGLTWFGK
jgi:hypothetical protein